MNPTQAAVYSSLCSSKVKPYVLSYSSVSAAAASLTVPIPRAPGKLCIVSTACFGGGTATPGLLTGFTSLASSARAANIPGVQIQYKYLNGSEAVTLASAATAATIMNANVLLIEGAISTRVPTISTVFNGFDATAVAVPAPQTQTLVISTLFADSLISLTSAPQELGPQFFNAGNLASANAVAWRSGFALSSIDLSAWAAVATVTSRVYTLAVRGA